jgi:hypothetical protein
MRRIVCERDLKSIIDRFSELLPASDVPFGRLHRRMTKEKLNLFEFASGLMAEAGASATKIVGCQMVNADSFGVSLHGIPDHVTCDSSILPSPILRNSSEHLAFSHSRVMEPYIYQIFTPRRHGTVRSRPPFPNISRSPSDFPSIAADPIVGSRFPSVANRIRAGVQSLLHLSCRAGALGNSIQ